MKRVIVSSLIFGLMTVLTACETVKGVGKDITNAGEAMEEAVK